MAIRPIEEIVAMEENWLQKLEGSLRLHLWNSDRYGLESNLTSCLWHEMDLALFGWRLGQDPTAHLKAVIETCHAGLRLISELADPAKPQQTGSNEVNDALFAGMVLYRTIDPSLQQRLCPIPRGPKESKRFFYHYMDAQLIQ